MRILLTGANGMLGRDLAAALADHEVLALGRDRLDVTDRAAAADAAAGCDAIVNASAYTRVDDAETHEAEAYAVNAIGAENLALAARAAGARFVTVSTDYVFDGTATEPYPEDTPRRPLNAYGRTKAAGEERSLTVYPDNTTIVRTAWLYGAHGPNFAKTMVALAATHDTVSVVDDQLGQPTWTGDLAAAIRGLLESGAPAGIYHGTSSGHCSWFEFARAIFFEAGLDPERVTPTDSRSFPRPAARPTYSVLGHDAFAAAGLEPLPDWRDALHRAAAAGAITP